MAEVQTAAPPLQSPLKHQFDALAQQHEADTLGMWLFLATEVMFFGGALTAYAIYRSIYGEGFGHGSRLLDPVGGTIMTVILLGSSFTMALAVHAAQTGSRRRVALFLLLTIVLGIAFIGLKGFEYYHKYEEHHVPFFDFHYEGGHAREVRMFLWFYFALTGLHALHMIIGIAILSLLAWQASRARVRNFTVEMTGLYWHFVDIVWIFLFPLLYLYERHG